MMRKKQKKLSKQFIYWHKIRQIFFCSFHILSSVYNCFAFAGQDLSPNDFSNIQKFPQRIINVSKFWRNLYEYLVTKMNFWFKFSFLVPNFPILC